MKKARRIKAGVLAFTAVVSVAVTSVPVYAVEDSPVAVSYTHLTLPTN